MLTRLKIRLRGLLRKAEMERELEEELRFHLEKEIEQNLARGLDAAQARAAALRSFGGVEQTKEASRDARGMRYVEEMWQDLGYSVRVLLKRKGFAAIAVATLALGIGANTAIFTVVNSVLLRPLPYAQPERILTMRSNQSALDVADIKAASKTFSEIGGSSLLPLDYSGGGEPVQIMAGLVTGGFFDVLGVPPMLGRVLTRSDDQRGRPHVIVLSHELWQQQFNGDPGVIGRLMRFSGNSYTVIGVMPPGFRSPRENAEAWVPIEVAYPAAAGARGVHFLTTYCRLAPGVTPAQAAAEMKTLDQQLATLYPEHDKRRNTILIPLHDRVVGDSRQSLLLMFGAVGLVLLIACANFANLLLVRSSEREREFVVRSALGASRARLVRQLLVESVVLALTGGIAGVLLAWLGVVLLQALKPRSLPRLESISVDWRVLLFTLGLSILTGILFGLMPALSAARHSLTGMLKEGGRNASGGRMRQRVRGALVVSELALALVLLVSAGLLVKTFWALRAIAPGFNPANVWTLRIDLPEARYSETEKQTRFRRQALAALNDLPGVQAAMISEVPMSGDSLFHDFLIKGRPPLQPGTEPRVETRSVMGDYFGVMQIPVRAGRGFTAQDLDSPQLVGVVNESLAREHFKGETPLGQYVRWARGPVDRWILIIGIVGDVRHFGPEQPELPTLYTPYPQADPWKRWMSAVIRTQPGFASRLPAIKQTIWNIDPSLPITRLKPLGEVMAELVAPLRFSMLLLGMFAALALLLSAIGIYGVMSYAVAQRTHELGIRLALGAQRRDVFGLVIGQGFKLTLIGVACGTLSSLAATRLMKGLLFGVSATDPPIFVIIAALLAGVALLACYLPARRAMKVDPILALRYE